MKRSRGWLDLALVLAIIAVGAALLMRVHPVPETHHAARGTMWERIGRVGMHTMQDVATSTGYPDPGDLMEATDPSASKARARKHYGPPRDRWDGEFKEYPAEGQGGAGD